MTALATLLSHALVVYMVAIWPVLGRARYRSLQKKLRDEDAGARTRVYRRMILHQWTIVMAVMVIMVLGSIPPATLGLRKPDEAWLEATTLLVLLAAIGASALFFRWKADGMVKRLLKMAGAILPVTARERWLFVAISIGAGISEEMLFRGFLLYYLDQHFPGLDSGAQILMSGLVFGWAHLFQGWRGIALTGMLGAAFALLYIATGSLLSPIVIHAAIDLRILLIVTPERMRALGLANGIEDSARIAP
jgi:membrane protease YdiL (CAAX protease family)